ncbi:MAG: signal recognition particle-docking protein FtsY [Spirochaetaceae bacterium]|jgi:fused signal recognition particle receptor|nr:signal recognition particle-docking protein FtsY [Spirochaetaceae bacterium]
MAINFAQKIKSFFKKGSVLNDDFFDDLCDILVESDFGVELAFSTIDGLSKKCAKEKISNPDTAKDMLCDILKDIIKNANPQNDNAPLIAADKINVILLLGVNGVGKTTTCAKLAFLYKQNAKTILAAADTFRAAAIEQLKIHGERLQVRVVAGKNSGDPASVVFDALQAAIHGGYQFLIADTAGRMHTKQGLVDELKKIDRVVLTQSALINYKKILVLDATTGTNALAQAETFNEAVTIDGCILTKFDSAAKGGVVFPLAKKFRLPVFFVCNGEKYEDISPFNADDYVREFLP